MIAGIEATDRESLLDLADIAGGVTTPLPLATGGEGALRFVEGDPMIDPCLRKGPGEPLESMDPSEGAAPLPL